MQYTNTLALDEFFDRKVLTKYNTAGPRYTSYPTAIAFHEDIKDEQIKTANKRLIDSKNHQNMSLYVHIPFCHQLCYYCGCNKIVTRHQDKADKYLTYLEKEVDLVAPLYSAGIVTELHLGGGTPNFLTQTQLARLIDMLKTKFHFDTDAQLSIEIDPRTVDEEYLTSAYKLGFRRLSIGVQDTDVEVQKAINRVQSTQHIASLIKSARHLGYQSINLDLIYGLPHQTQTTFAKTLAEVEKMNPDRVSLFSYAHLPKMFAAQRKIKDDWLPNADAKFSLFRQAIQFMTNIGYDFVGMDHFARPEDKLSIAQREKSLYRNFQGYTTGVANSCIGLGASSISSIENIYLQNAKDLKDYYQLLDQGKRPLVKGIQLSRDDEIRRDLIHQLMCNFELDIRHFELKHQINFTEYFEQSLASLDTFIDDGLISLNQDKILIHQRGRLIVRNICMSFDQYLSQPMHQMRYSRVI